jgi:Zn-dependent peptidase ImmA (M78 family)
MRRRVPYLTEDFIERDAAALIAEYERARGVTLVPPIPVEDIVEKHLKLGIEFDDMHARHGVPRPPSGETDILGAIYGDGSIFIDESLDPENNPSKEGRYRFTLAHEGGGHWRLHKHLVVEDAAQSSLFGEAREPSFICRSSQAKEREEWQADFYASCLLMPRPMIYAAWEDFAGSRRPRAINGDNRVALFADIDAEPVPTKLTYSIHNRPTSDSSEITIPLHDLGRAQDVLRASTVDDALARFCRPLAERFAVSPIAMRIRLEKLGLLLRAVPYQPLLTTK